MTILYKIDDWFFVWRYAITKYNQYTMSVCRSSNKRYNKLMERFLNFHLQSYNVFLSSLFFPLIYDHWTSTLQFTFFSHDVLVYCNLWIIVLCLDEVHLISRSSQDGQGTLSTKNDHQATRRDKHNNSKNKQNKSSAAHFNTKVT